MQNITLLDPQFHTRPTRLSRGFSALTSTITPSLLSPSLVRSSQVFFRSLKKQPRRVYIALTSSSGARDTTQLRGDGIKKRRERIAFPFVLTSLSFLLSGVLQHRICAISMRVAFKGSTAGTESGNAAAAPNDHPRFPASPAHFLSAPLSPQKALLS